MKNLSNRVLDIAYSLNIATIIATFSQDSIPFARKAIYDWFDYANEHGIDNYDLEDLKVTPESTDEEIKTAIIEEWKAETEELRAEREFQFKHDLGLA